MKPHFTISNSLLMVVTIILNNAKFMAHTCSTKKKKKNPAKALKLCDISHAKSPQNNKAKWLKVKIRSKNDIVSCHDIWHAKS